MRPHGSPEQLERRRRRALGLLKDGLTLTAVAQRVGCSASSVHLWREAARRGGLAALAATPATGRPPKLSPRQQARLLRELAKGAPTHGYPTDLWTTRRVATVIWRRFQVRYHPNHVWRLLTGLGWSCQKPERRAQERDEAAIARWKRRTWPRLKKGRRTWGPTSPSSTRPGSS